MRSIKKWIGILGLLLCSAIPASSTCTTTWTLANVQYDSVFSTATTHDLPAFSSALTPGSVIVVPATYRNNGTNAIVSVTDTAGNTFLDSGAGNALPGAGGPVEIQVFYAINSFSTASDVITVTYNNPGDNFYHNGQALEFTSSGTIAIDTFSRIDQVDSTGDISVDSIFLTPLTAAVNCDLVVAVAGNLTGNVMSPGITANTWISGVATEGFAGLTTEYFVKPTSGSITPAFFDVNNESFAGIAIAFLGSGTTPVARHLLIDN